MSIIREGYYFIAVALAVAVLLGIAINPYAAIFPTVLAVYL